jgi:hypothetical protein
LWHNEEWYLALGDHHHRGERVGPTTVSEARTATKGGPRPGSSSVAGYRCPAILFANTANGFASPNWRR